MRNEILTKKIIISYSLGEMQINKLNVSVNTEEFIKSKGINTVNELFNLGILYFINHGIDEIEILKIINKITELDKGNNQLYGINLYQKSIDLLTLSQRTRNSLIKNGIQFVEQLILYNRTSLINREGMGSKGLDEINNALSKNFSEVLEKVGKSRNYNINLNSENAIIFETPLFFLETDYTILVKLQKGEVNSIECIKSLGLEGIKNISGIGPRKAEYILKKAEGISSEITFSMLDLIKIYEKGKDTLFNDLMIRLGYHNGEKLVLEKIAEMHGITRERIRQKEQALLKDIQYNFGLLGSSKEFKIKFLDSLTYKKEEDYLEIDFSKLGDSKYTYQYFTDLSMIILGDEYTSYSIQETAKMLILSNEKEGLKGYIESFMKKFLKIYESKRIDHKIANLSQMLEINSNHPYRTNILSIVKNILSEGYNKTVSDNGDISFDINKRDINYLMQKEIMNFPNGIHFRDLYVYMKNKYPKLKRKMQTVHAKVMCLDGVTNIGQGLRAYKPHTDYHGGICDYAETFIKKNGGPVKYYKLEYFLLKNRKTNKTSINIMLFKGDVKDRFVKLKGKYVGLKNDLKDYIKEGYIVSPSNDIEQLSSNDLDYDEYGFNKRGVHKNGTRCDNQGFYQNGYNREGFNRDGFNRQGYDRYGFNKQGKQKNGELYNNREFNVNGDHKNGTKYDDLGYDIDGFNKEFFNSLGYNIDGFNREGRHISGII